MAKREMVALKEHVYGGRRYKAGDRYFVVGESDRATMKAVGHSDDAPPLEVEPPKPEAAQAVRAAKTTRKAQVAAPETPEAETAPKRTNYLTRRLQALDVVAADAVTPPVEAAAEAAPATDPAADVPASDA